MNLLLTRPNLKRKLPIILALFSLLLCVSNVRAQKCLNSKSVNDLKQKFEEENYFEVKKLADKILSDDSTCIEALFYRARYFGKQKNKISLAADLLKLKTGSNLKFDELEICGDLADSALLYDYATSFFQSSYSLNNSKPKSVYVKMLYARFNNGDKENLYVVVDSLIKAEPRPESANIYAKKLRVLICQYLFDNAQSTEDKTNYAELLRIAYISYFRKQYDYFGQPGKKLPEYLLTTDHCDPYFFIANIYYSNKQLNFSLLYLDYLKSSNCNINYKFLHDSLSFLIFKSQNNKEKTYNFLQSCLDAKESSSFFLREKTIDLLSKGNHYTLALDPINRAIKNNPKDSANLIFRALLYEENQDINKAYYDIQSLQTFYGKDIHTTDCIRIYDKYYESNREHFPPQIKINDGIPYKKNTYKISIPIEQKTISISGTLTDQSEINEFSINSINVSLDKINLGEYKFEANLELQDTVKILKCIYKDNYDNLDSTFIKIFRTIPASSTKIRLNNPPFFTEIDTQEIYVDPNQHENILFRGTIESPYRIVSIKVNGVLASRNQKANGYDFEATILLPKDDSLVSIGYIVEDDEERFFNFKINKKDEQQSKKQVSGRTWLVIISNSEYENFSELQGAEEDIYTIENALKDYTIQKTIVRRNMKTQEMSNFLNRDLNTLIKNAQVSTLLLWYAGHGKYSATDETAYWIPIDAESDVTDHYYSLNDLKDKLNKVAGLSNLLIVSDACETGMLFLDTKRGEENFSTCENTPTDIGKSFYALTSSTDKGTNDISELCKLFSQQLKNALKGKSSCVNLLEVAMKVKKELLNLNKEPQFGHLTDIKSRENPSFFIEKK